MDTLNHIANELFLRMCAGEIPEALWMIVEDEIDKQKALALAQSVSQESGTESDHLLRGAFSNYLCRYIRPCTGALKGQGRYSHATGLRGMHCSL